MQLEDLRVNGKTVTMTCGFDSAQEAQTFAAGFLGKPAAAVSAPATEEKASRAPRAAAPKAPVAVPAAQTPTAVTAPTQTADDDDDEFAPKPEAKPAARAAKATAGAPCPPEISGAGNFREVMTYLLAQGVKTQAEIFERCEAWKSSCPPIARLGDKLADRIERALLVLTSDAPSA